MYTRTHTDTHTQTHAHTHTHTHTHTHIPVKEVNKECRLCTCNIFIFSGATWEYLKREPSQNHLQKNNESYNTINETHIFP